MPTVGYNLVLTFSQKQLTTDSAASAKCRLHMVFVMLLTPC